MSVAIGNVAEIRIALKEFAPDLNAELVQKWGQVLKPVVSRARGFVSTEPPMHGWTSSRGKAINRQSSVFRRGKFPLYNAAEIKRGIVYKTTPSKVTRSGYVNLVRIQNKSAAGAIYETAGRKNGQGQDWVGPNAGGLSKGVSRSPNPYAGNQFISNLGQLYGYKKNVGRLIFRAWAETQGRANAEIIKTVEAAVYQFNRRTEIVDIRRAA